MKEEVWQERKRILYLMEKRSGMRFKIGTHSAIFHQVIRSGFPEIHKQE